MIKLILICIVAYSITFTMVESIIMSKFREFVSKVNFFKLLFNCMFCTGFWVSFGLQFYYNIFTVTFGYSYPCVNELLCSFFYAAMVWFIAITEHRIG